MKSKIAIISTWMCISAILVGSSNAADNAFGSLISDNINNSSISMQAEPGQVIDKTLHPLIQNTVASNTLIALMISPSLNIGLIRTVNGDRYFVRIGDKLGNGGGIITNFEAGAIEVTEDGEVLSLAVRNRSLDESTQ